jgi:hypothetical protein
MNMNDYNNHGKDVGCLCRELHHQKMSIWVYGPPRVIPQPSECHCFPHVRLDGVAEGWAAQGARRVGCSYIAGQPSATTPIRKAFHLLSSM